jgi:hypothetical protein
MTAHAAKASRGGQALEVRIAREKDDKLPIYLMSWAIFRLPVLNTIRMMRKFMGEGLEQNLLRCRDDAERGAANRYRRIEKTILERLRRYCWELP